MSFLLFFQPLLELPAKLLGVEVVFDKGSVPFEGLLQPVRQLLGEHRVELHAVEGGGEGEVPGVELRLGVGQHGPAVAVELVEVPGETFWSREKRQPLPDAHLQTLLRV